jgi:hypothetical protein
MRLAYFNDKPYNINLIMVEVYCLLFINSEVIQKDIQA